MAVKLFSEPSFHPTLPEQYQTGSRNTIIADATITSFTEFPYYYEVGTKLALIVRSLTQELFLFLQYVWEQRYRALITIAHTFDPTNDKPRVKRMSQTEQDGFFSL
jgi:hypothetical protein